MWKGRREMLRHVVKRELFRGKVEKCLGCEAHSCPLFPFPRSHTSTRFKEQQGERVRAKESVLWNVSGRLTSSGDFGCENDFHTDTARGMRFEFPAQLIAFRRARLSELEFIALTLYFPRCNFASRSPRIEFESIWISLLVAQLS